MSELRSTSDDDEIVEISDVSNSSTGNLMNPSTITISDDEEHSQNVLNISTNTAGVEFNLSSTNNRQFSVPEENIPSSNSNSNNNRNLNSTDVCDNLPSCSRNSNVNTPSLNPGMNDEVSNSASGSSVRMETGDLANSSSATSSTTVGQVLECPICLLTCVHPTRLPCGHIFCYLCVKGVANKNHRCAMCRRNIPPEFLEHPQLVNGTEDICSTKATDDGYQWFYEGRNGWWQYDDRTSQDIEEAYKKGEKSCIILVAGYVYVVDLEAMLQQRQNEPSRCRRVKRDLATIPKKGVAGLRIEGGNIVTAEISSSHYNQTLIPTLQQSLMLPLSYDVGDNHQQLYQLDYQADSSNNSEIRNISTIAATDAAIRIASDIIGSTLAHADELTRRRSSMPSLAGNSNTGIENYLSGEQNSLLTSNSISNSIPVSSSTTMLASSSSSLHSSLNNPATPPPLFRPLFTGNDQRRTIDLIEQTLNDFHALTLRNIIDSSDEEFNNGEAANIDNDNDDDDEFNIHNIARNILATSTVLDDSSEDTNDLTTNINTSTSTLTTSNNLNQSNNDREQQIGD